MSYNLYSLGNQVGSFQLRNAKMGLLLSWLAGPILKVAQASCLFTEYEVTGWKPILPFVGGRMGTIGPTMGMLLKIYSEKGDLR